MDSQNLTDWILPEHIATPLHRMAGEEAELSGTWTTEQFKTGRGDGLGVWRIAGTMKTPNGEEPWSMVLKGWSCIDWSGMPSAFNYPWREAELYSSSTLVNLPGVLAPTCFDSVERDGSIWVWLEDLTSVPQPDWAMDHYAKAAQRLGWFNGAYLAGKPIPIHNSLSHRWLAEWTAAGTHGMAILNDQIDDPLVRKLLPPDVRTGFFHVWNRRQAILDGLDNMPQTFCHRDAFHRNTFFVGQEDHEELMLIDWSFSGPGAIGEELVALCVAGIIFGPSMFDKIDEIERVAFDAYMDGLRDAGWRGAGEDVWRAYRSAAILRYGPAVLQPVISVLRSEQGSQEMADAMGVPSGRIQDHVARLWQWVARHADEV